ncbi:MAG: DNA-directed RNA polymerase subunit D [Candidatus Aenigmarchaeota archaeon]|nr:DNA-directed RNA polymerase subunit D [Candidatus Aenigmarchaeota archaeon]
MRIQVLKKNEEKINFKIFDISSAFAGEMRNIMISEIPTLAIEWVDFHKNDSVICDEIIANRLGLIPLKFDPKKFKFKEECKCKGKGCSQCQVKLSLKKKGPCVIYSGDMKSTDKSVKPLYDNIPITELNTGQELEFEAYAELGIGKTHAKWQGAIVGYRNLAKITITKKGENCKEAAKFCPRDVFTVKNNKLKVKDADKCNLCMQCVEKCGKDTIKILPDKNSFVFQVERACGLSIKNILIKSMDILSEKLKEFSKQIEKLK